MCGLVGCAGDIGKDDIATFNNLIVIDSIRGPHSTGVASVSHGKRDIDWIKKVGNPYELFECKTYERVVGFGKCVLLGHNRYATVGKVCNNNAHPFQHGDIVGAHNGTLSNLRDSGMPGVGDFDTDSETIIHSINELGADKTIPMLRGAWTLVWYDKYENTINFLRNPERPLCYMFTESNRTLYWASEPSMLYLACNRNGVKMGEVKILPPDTLMSWEVPMKWNDKFEEGTRQKLVGKPMPPVSEEAWAYGGGWHRPSYQGNNVSKPVVKPEEKKEPLADPFEDGANGTTSNGLSSTTKTPTSQTGSTNTPTSPTSTTSGTTKSPGLTTEVHNGNPKETFVWDRKTGEMVKKPSPTSSTTSATTSEESNSTEKQGSTKPNLQVIEGGKKADEPSTFRGWQGRNLSRAEFECLTVDGCAYCEADIAWGEPVRFISFDECVCKDCMKNSSVISLIGVEG